MTQTKQSPANPARFTGIIMRQMDSGRFSFQDFYVRRVRRLLPAAYLVLAVSMIAATMLTSAAAFPHFWQQFLGTLTFSTNFVLWKQINYFNNNAAFEPLLHMWSLAVEEQYYLILPIVLRVIPKRLWFVAVVAVTVASLAAYGYLYPRSPGAAFYLLPTRAWEIGIGSLATFAPSAPRLVAAASRLAPIAALVTVAICFVPGGSSSAHLLAIPACLAVATVIVARRGTVRLTRPLAPLVAIGDFSYSLYLVHWPLFAFAHTIYMSNTLPTWLSLMLVALTVVLAQVLYRRVEEPVRRAPVEPKRAWIIAVAGSVALVLACTIALQVKRRHAPAIDLTPVMGLESPFCTGEGTAIDPRCGQGPNPQILIWGDSLSQAITPAIDATTDRPIVEASKGQCAPLPGVAPVDRDSPPAFAKGCLDFNDSVLDYIAKTPSIEVVILSGRYYRLMSDGTQAMRRGADGSTTISIGGLEPMITAQTRLTARLRTLGRRVVVIAPPPQASFDVGACWMRQMSKLPTIMPSAPPVPACAIQGAGMLAETPLGRQLMDAFTHTATTPVIRLDTAMCVGGVCPTAWNGVPLYVDAAHLSRTGSVLVGKRFALGVRAWAEAR